MARIPSTGDLPGQAHFPGFAADGSGFALLADCSKEGCRQQVAVLERGASRWTNRKVPLKVVRGDDGISADLSVLGPGRALLSEDGRTWFTKDGAHTWIPVPLKPSGTIAEIPAGARLSTNCDSPEVGGSCQSGARVTVISAEDGRTRYLASQPDLRGHLDADPYVQSDGSWWVSGRSSSGTQMALAVSRDAGRTWTTAPLPGSGPRHTFRVEAAVGPDAVYATEIGELADHPAAKNPLRGLYRSADGGRSWHQVWRAVPGKEPATSLGAPIPAPGNRLIIHSENASSGGAYLSADGGRTFRHQGGVSAWITRTPTGYLRGSTGCTYSLSADGLTWHDFTLGSC